MWAVGFTEFGDASVLKIVALPMPEPGPGQVRAKVAAAAVNASDISMRRGGVVAMPDAVRPPYILGMDLAGVIDAVGQGVTGWAAGDRVMAAVSALEPGGGAQAEYRLVGGDQLARVPEGISQRTRRSTSRRVRSDGNESSPKGEDKR